MIKRYSGLALAALLLSFSAFSQVRLEKIQSYMADTYGEIVEIGHSESCGPTFRDACSPGFANAIKGLRLNGTVVTAGKTPDEADKLLSVFNYFAGQLKTAFNSPLPGHDGAFLSVVVPTDRTILSEAARSRIYKIEMQLAQTHTMISSKYEYKAYFASIIHNIFKHYKEGPHRDTKAEAIAKIVRKYNQLVAKDGLPKALNGLKPVVEKFTIGGREYTHPRIILPVGTHSYPMGHIAIRLQYLLGDTNLGIIAYQGWYEKEIFQSNKAKAIRELLETSFAAFRAISNSGNYAWLRADYQFVVMALSEATAVTLLTL